MSVPAWSVDNNQDQTYGEYIVYPSCNALSSPTATTCKCVGYVRSHRGLHTCAVTGFQATGYKDRENTDKGTVHYALVYPSGICGIGEPEVSIQVTFPKCPAYVPPLSLSTTGGITPIVFGKTPAQVTVRSLMPNSSGNSISVSYSNQNLTKNILSTSTSQGSWTDIATFTPQL